MLRRVVTVAGVVLLAASAAHATLRPFPRFGVGCRGADFSSGGATVRAMLCGRTSGTRAVIVLHGCGGFGTFDHRLTAYAAARDAGVRSALFVYPEGSHGWPGRQGAVGIARAAAFLRQTLG